MIRQRVGCPGRGVGSVRVTWRVAFPTATMFLLITGFPATAQRPYPIFKEDHLVKTMKAVGLNFEGANESLADSDLATAKARFTRVREQLAPTITFWRDRKKDDAIRMLRDTIAKLDDLDAALSIEKADVPAARALATQVDAACQSCHAAHREQDPTTKAYRLKTGSVQ